MGLQKSLNKLERQRNISNSTEEVCTTGDTILYHGGLQLRELDQAEDISSHLERMESSPLLLQSRYCSCDDPSESITVDSERVSLANSDYSLETIKKLCASFDEDIPSFSENMENISS